MKTAISGRPDVRLARAPRRRRRRLREAPESQCPETKDREGPRDRQAGFPRSLLAAEGPSCDAGESWRPALQLRAGRAPVAHAARHERLQDAAARHVCAAALLVAGVKAMSVGERVIIRTADAVSGVEYVLPCTLAWVHDGSP